MVRFGEKIAWKVEEGVGHLVLSDPPRNGMTAALFRELGHVVRNVVPRSGARALLVYGEGRHFSSGADLGNLMSSILEDIRVDGLGRTIKYPPFLMENMDTFMRLEQTGMPVVAAIRGVCLGVALELALFCHYRLCTGEAVLGLPETTFNLIPGCGGTLKLQELAGFSKALELILKGEHFSSDEALRWCVVDAVLPRKGFIEAAAEFARRLPRGRRRQRAGEQSEILRLLGDGAARVDPSCGG